MTHFALVITTVDVPKIISDFNKNFKKFGRHGIDAIIIGDRKTPDAQAERFLRTVPSDCINVEYFGVKRQRAWLKDFKKLEKIVPYNSDNRRNIGYLIALQGGADVVASVDSDNFPINTEDFIKGHSVVSRAPELPAVFSRNGWFNVCEMLENNMGARLYPRGFPYSARFTESAGTYSVRRMRKKIAVNEGLWINAPDVDAVTALAAPARITRTSSRYGKRILLPKGVWSPINSQNTAVSRKAMPAYYFLSMECSINGIKLDRYGDIWQGYFIKKIADAMNEGVSFGAPLSNHVRLQHDYLKDLKSELWGAIFNERIFGWLTDTELHSKSYPDAYLELSDDLYRKSAEIGNGYGAFADYLKRVSGYMRIWVDSCDRAT